MKKNLFLAIFLIAINSLSWGQLNIIMAGDNHILNDSTIVVHGNTTSEMNVNLYVINPSNVSSITVYARRDSISLPAWSHYDNSFCWGGLCYDTTTDVSPLSETIGAGDTSNSMSAPEFNGHYFPFGHAGMAKIRYVFYKANFPADSSWIIVEYDAIPTGIAPISDKAINFSAPYPNPAGNSVSFSYSFANRVQSASLKIFNMLGECVRALPLNASKNKATIELQSIPSGVYVCEVEAEDCQPAYQKLVVSH